MDILEDMRQQRAVYWPPMPPTRHGQKTYDTPVELLVRWEQTGEVFLDRDGNQQVSRAMVYVGDDVLELGVLWLSTKTLDDSEGSALGELTDESDPFLNPGAYEIRRFEKMPTLDGALDDEYLRCAYL